MKLKLAVALSLFACLISGFSQQNRPLRVFIRAGVKTHGPDQHDHPRFLAEWKELLNQRGARADGSMEFPTAEQLDNTDVLVIYAQDGMKITGDQRANFEKFLRRGAGLVVIHDGVVSGDQNEWAKKVQGGSWRWDGDKKTRWLEGDVGIYFVEPKHPIVQGVSNFDWTDEIYYDMDMAPDAHVLATSFHSVFVIAPQLWTYEKTWEGGSAPYRAFVSIPGHEYASFRTPHYRAVLLRGIAWAGKGANVDALCSKEELNSLTYPAGGPTAPENAAVKLNVDPEFGVSLVAAEPLIEKVISLDWDGKGRLWVAETPEYPNGRAINRNDAPIYPDRAVRPDQYRGDKVDRPARDRISWLEDTNGDGQMDRKHIFADFEHGVPGGLELVTSLVLYKDGVIVAQAPDILWLRDTNGDGVADKVQTLYTGFGTGDTHAVINNFRWGMDGWIYSAIGYSAGNPRSSDGVRDFGRVTAGVIRFRPDGSALEQVASGSCNTWGFDFAPDGEMFYTTATCGEHLLHIVMPEKVLARGNVGGLRASAVLPDHQKIFPAVHHTRPAYIQIDWVGMFTAAAGSCIYNGGAWPDRFNGSHFLSEPTVSLVHNDWLKPNGVTYVASKQPGREETEFIAGNDLWFRPIHTRVGPDGALYVVDFYNQAAIHNDTRGPAHGAHNAATRPDRDHHFGRIWRVQHKEASKLPPYKLDPNKPADLVKALEHPNGWVRGTAQRLLSEAAGNKAASSLAKTLKSGTTSFARLNALWTLNNLGKLDNGLLLAALEDKDAVLRKNALRVVGEHEKNTDAAQRKAVLARLTDTDPRTRLNALIALANFEASPDTARAIVAVWPELKDKYLESAALGNASRDPLLFVEAAFTAKEAAFLAPFVSHVVRLLANQQDAGLAVKLVAFLGRQPAAIDSLKQVALESLAANLKPSVVPSWSPDLQAALRTLVGSERPGLAGAVLPIIARWDKAGALAADLKPLVAQLGARLRDASLRDDQRAQVAANLLGVRHLDSGIVPGVASLLGTSASPDLQKKIIEALGSTGDAAVGREFIAVYSKVPGELRETVLGQVFTRADWSLTLVQALAEKRIDYLALGPSNLHRLRTHPDKTVAARANAVIDELKGPEQKEKEQLIARFRPEVERPGNVDNGHKLFLANCASCHVFKEEGRNLAPNLTGMGAHGAGELLVHIVDPNRLVEPNFVSTGIETKDDLNYDGIVERENNVEVLLRNANGDFTIRKDNIKSRTSTGRSLMPEGFEALGGDGLRDVLTWICADEGRFRILDLTPAFTANTSRGIFNSEEAKDETLRFRKSGTIKVGDIPFEIMSPAKSPSGRNVVVLKGGNGFSRTLPQRVEAKVGFAARQLHFLGGVGGWAYPCCGDNKNEGLPVVKVTLHFAGGATEEMVLKNGVEFADYIGRFDVPGSKEAPELLQRGQLRWFSKEVRGRDVIEHISLESFNNSVAPAFVGITAELAESPVSSASPSASRQEPVASSSAAREAAPVSTQAKLFAAEGGRGAGASAANTTRVLIVGGGSSHDFGRWFNEADSKTLSASGKSTVGYTDKPDAILSALKDLDVLYLSNNQPMTNAALRKAIFDFADAGKGLLLVHPALWYNWADWPEYNRALVGGGARSHDKYGEFEVIVDAPDHPLMSGVPKTFKITDELYHFQRDEQGAAMEVLASGRNLATGKSYPAVWITKHPKARIVCITLGHDGAAHESDAYKTILQNALKWAAGK
jgi:putative membrane-bound dehydrogenase-like protein